jgi:hypothetical protein
MKENLLDLELAGVVPAPWFGGKEPPCIRIKHYKSNTYKRAALPLALFHVAMRTKQNSSEEPPWRKAKSIPMPLRP